MLLRLLCPYLINTKNLSIPEATHILNDWLQQCNQIRKLDFNPRDIIKNDLKGVGEYKPPSLETLKRDRPQLYDKLKSNGIFKD